MPSCLPVLLCVTHPLCSPGVAGEPSLWVGSPRGVGILNHSVRLCTCARLYHSFRAQMPGPQNCRNDINSPEFTQFTHYVPLMAGACGGDVYL